MRISDWSSDVCSSDLLGGITGGYTNSLRVRGSRCVQRHFLVDINAQVRRLDSLPHHRHQCGHLDRPHAVRADAELVRDRKSVVEGKSVSVRVDLGGRRNLKKTKQMNTERKGRK